MHKVSCLRSQNIYLLYFMAAEKADSKFYFESALIYLYCFLFKYSANILAMYTDVTLASSRAL